MELQCKDVVYLVNFAIVVGFVSRDVADQCATHHPSSVGVSKNSLNRSCCGSHICMPTAVCLPPQQNCLFWIWYLDSFLSTSQQSSRGNEVGEPRWDEEIGILRKKNSEDIGFPMYNFEKIVFIDLTWCSIHRPCYISPNFKAISFEKDI